MRYVPVLRRNDVPARWWPETTPLFDSLWKNLALDFPFETEGGIPAVDIQEKDGTLIFRAELPGVDEKDIKLELDGNVLTLKGERRLHDEDKRETYHRIERHYGAFSRSFTLPDTADRDKIKADYKNGVMTITVSQKPESKARAIPVTTN